jgi:hypothetical protein
MAKSTSKRSAKGRKGKPTRLVSLPGDDGAHYTPLAGGKWLRSRRSKGNWEHALMAKPAIASSGSAGPRLASTACAVDGCDYINLGNGRYWRSCPNPDGTWTQGGVDESQVPPACRST